MMIIVEFQVEFGRKYFIYSYISFIIKYKLVMNTLRKVLLMRMHSHPETQHRVLGHGVNLTGERINNEMK